MIAILLTTYNSKEYLYEQIDSLKKQTYQEWNLFVRDDMSTDRTPSIVKELSCQDQRIHFLADDKKRGAKDGFMWLLEHVEADYYMFCDHDDVWLPEKIEKSFKVLLEQPDKENVPIIVCTNAKLVDGQLQIIEDSYWNYKCYKSWMFSDRHYHLFYNNVLGCTMLFNKKAKQIALPYPPDIVMHDAWLAASVLWHRGRIIPIHEPLLLYRQHKNNTIGSPQMPSIIQQLRNFFSLFQKTRLQYNASKPLFYMPFFIFFMMKTKYMLSEHFRHFIKHRSQ